MLNTQILTPAVESLVRSLLSIVPDRDWSSLNAYAEMVETHPTVAASADLRILLGVSMLREFVHPDETIQADIRRSISAMPGSWLDRVAKMNQFILYGRSFSEVGCAVKKRRGTLAEIRTIDPRRYRFQGTQGTIDTVLYNGFYGDISIPYDSGIHLVNQPYMALDNNPYGIALCKRALPYWELFKLLMAALAIAGQRQATPILVGKTDTSTHTYLYDSAGNPLTNPETGEPYQINQGASMLRSLESVQNNSALVIDRLDELVPIAQNTDGKLIFSALRYCTEMMELAFLVPQTVTGSNNSGVGDTGLNEGHREILRLVTIAQMKLVSEALIEKVARPLIEFNYGAQDDYGTFPVAEEDSTDTVRLLDAIGKIVASGGFSNQDLSVVNRMRVLSGIEPVDKLETMTESAIGGNSTNDRAFSIRLPLRD